MLENDQSAACWQLEAVILLKGVEFSCKQTKVMCSDFFFVRRQRVSLRSTKYFECVFSLMKYLPSRVFENISNSTSHTSGL